ncbi:MAG: hypothetical protein HRT67_00420 [Flavobacteriaceae bacterium]|nr:hypothetical protein [Flavobacteriaceae bacterium]
MAYFFIKKILIILLGCCLLSCESQPFQLEEGHILFQDLDKDAINGAIEQVTKTDLEYNFTHVAIVVRDNDELKILEAVTKGVQMTTVKEFLDRNRINGKPKVVVGVLKPELRTGTKAAIAHGKTLIGSPYDPIYKIGDNAYYCSELLYEMYHHVNPNAEIFQLNPMTFKNPKTNKTLPFWEAYYKKLNHKIPEGELGLNPNGMSVSPNITLIYDYFLEKAL